MFFVYNALYTAYCLLLHFVKAKLQAHSSPFHPQKGVFIGCKYITFVIVITNTDR